jgi:DNA-binding transcriptional ArsR family regulator
MDEILELTEVFKALSDPTRLQLVKLLNDHEGALCVNALANKLDVSQSAVSQHLRVLRQAHLVNSNRQGPSVHYMINKEKLSEHAALLQATFGNAFV